MEKTESDPKKTEKTVEVKYEVQLGQLLVIVLVGVLLAVGTGFWIGKEVGFTQGFSQVTVEKPEYCTSDTAEGTVKIRCNELGNISLESFCEWTSPSLKDKIRLVLIT